jgi:hypothetical protein
MNWFPRNDTPTPLLEVDKYLAVHRAEPPVGTGSRFLRQQNIHVIVFGDLVGSLVDPLAAEAHYVYSLKKANVASI